MTTETTRRALVAGLAMAPLAGVPAVAVSLELATLIERRYSI